jgi:LPS sulfotransferase NodH
LSRPGTARLVRSDGTPAAATTILPRPIGWSYGRRVAPSSYLLCGTPRTGSTFLCSLLASTGVAGRPESFFREPDERWWAERLGVAGADFAWSDWFDRQGVEPHRVTYEELVRDPGGTVRGILAHLSLEAPPGWESRSSHEKQGDELNAAWIKAYRTRAAADSIRSAIMGPGDVSR